MKVIPAKLSERELKRRKEILAAEKESRPMPRRHGKAKVRVVGTWGDYTRVQLNGLPKTFVGKSDKVCPSCDNQGMTKWRRNGRVVVMCPRCGRTEDKGVDLGKGGAMHGKGGSK